jgi:inner membrane protein
VPAPALGARDVSLRRRLVAGALCAAFPDADFIANFVSPLTYLLNHRGITHSVVMLPLWSVLLALILAALFGEWRRWPRYLGLAAMGVGAHILGDLITSYGTMILAPFSDHRYAWGSTFIIDLWFTGIIVAGLLLSLAWKRSAIPAAAACLVLASFVMFEGWLKSQAIEFGVRQAQAAAIPGLSGPARVSAQPGPVSPFNWMVVLEQEGDYRYALVNLRRGEALPEPSAESGFFYRLSAPYRPVNAALWRAASLHGDGTQAGLIDEAWRQPAMAFFHWFAEYPALYRLDTLRGSTCAWFYDLRFLRPGSDVMPFRYGVCREGRGWQGYRLLESEAGADSPEPLY